MYPLNVVCSRVHISIFLLYYRIVRREGWWICKCNVGPDGPLQETPNIESTLPSPKFPNFIPSVNEAYAQGHTEKLKKRGGGGFRVRGANIEKYILFLSILNNMSQEGGRRTFNWWKSLTIFNATFFWQWLVWFNNMGMMTLFHSKTVLPKILQFKF